MRYGCVVFFTSDHIRSWMSSGTAQDAGIDLEILLECFLQLLDGISCEHESGGRTPSDSGPTTTRKWLMSGHIGPGSRSRFTRSGASGCSSMVYHEALASWWSPRRHSVSVTQLIFG